MPLLAEPANEAELAALCRFLERNGVRRVTLVNYDVLGSPIGIGESPLECWRKFIESCGEYARKLDAICAEAAVILSNLEK